MSPSWKLAAGLVLLLTGAGGLMLLRSHAPMTSQGGIKATMKTIMGGQQHMMGDSFPPGVKPTQLPEPGSRGARLLARYCSQCHGLPDPTRHTPGEWPEVVARMRDHQQTMGKSVMSDQDQAAIVGLLQQLAGGKK